MLAVIFFQGCLACIISEKCIVNTVNRSLNVTQRNNDAVLDRAVTFGQYQVRSYVYDLIPNSYSAFN